MTVQGIPHLGHAKVDGDREAQPGQDIIEGQGLPQAYPREGLPAKGLQMTQPDDESHQSLQLPGLAGCLEASPQGESLQKARQTVHPEPDG
jgi:hypothetical protein